MLNNVAPRIMAVIQAIIVMTRIVASPVKGISAIGMLPRTCDNLISLVVNRSTHLKSISCIRGDKSQIMGVYLKNNTRGPADDEQVDLEHGRIETRRIWVTSKLNGYLEFPHVGQAFMVERIVEYKNGRHKGWREYAYGITSLSAEQADAEQLLKDNRGHWSIESVHYMLDWNFDEDRSRIRTGHGPENMTRLRRFAIGVLKSKQKRYETVREQMLRLNRMPRVVLDYLKLTGNTALHSATPTATPPRL